MLSKAKLKYVESLRLKKQRQRHNAFIIEGEKMAVEVLTSKNIEIESIFALESWVAVNELLVRPHLSKIITVSETELKQLSNLSTPNKIVIVAQIPTLRYNDDAAIKNSFSLYLDGIQDPGNLGTILRIADWFSISYVFCSLETVDVWNPKVVQSSMGAFLRVRSLELPFSELKTRFPDLPVFATVLRGDDLFNPNFPQRGIIVIGNEGNGISEEIIALADYKITIHGGGGAESLNAAVSTGIVVATLTRKTAK